MMSQQLLPYHTYILRFWQEQENDDDRRVWRFTIEDPAQGARHGFSTLDELVNFLRMQLTHHQSQKE